MALGSAAPGAAVAYALVILPSARAIAQPHPPVMSALPTRMFAPSLRAGQRRVRRSADALHGCHQRVYASAHPSWEAKYMEDERSNKSLELAYDAAKQHLALQDSTLSSTRTRANNLLATTALFVSFSAGVGLLHTDPAAGEVIPAWVAEVLLILVVALGACVLVVVWPAKNWTYVPSASVILEKIDAGDDEALIRRYVTQAMIDGARTNHGMLTRKQTAFRCAVVLLVIEIALLLGALGL